MSAPTLRKNRDFQLLMGGRTLALIGGSMTSLSLMLLAMDLTGSAAVASAVSAANFVGNLLTSFVAGSLVDRWNRKLTMIVASLILAACLASIPLAGIAGHVTGAHLLLVSLAVGVLGMFYGPAEAAAIKRIVPPEQLGSAMTAQQMRWSVSSLIGGPLAGALYGVGRFLPLMVDALTNVVAAMCAGGVRSDLNPIERSRNRVIADSVEGLKWLWNTRGTRMVAIVSGLSTFSVFGLITSVTLGLRADNQQATTVGLVQTVVGGALLIGSMLTPTLQKLATLGRIFFIVSFVQVALVLLLASVRGPFAILVLFGLFAFSGPPSTIGLQAWFMAATPQRMQGRASAALNIITMGLVPIATLVAGWLIEQGGPLASRLPFGVVLVVVLAIAIASPTLRSLPKADALPEVARLAEQSSKGSHQNEPTGLAGTGPDQ